MISKKEECLPGYDSAQKLHTAKNISTQIDCNRVHLKISDYLNQNINHMVHYSGGDFLEAPGINGSTK